ncbi:30S ribosomal protein S5 [Candidatus Microgenomates bacterium]|nr:30S ribosomal protein S5 [Candidatus Microgenomates bacterium]
MDREMNEFTEKVIQVNRISKKTAGGNQMRFSALAVVGDKKGRVGLGLGKAPDVVAAINKATSYARKHLIMVPLRGTTIPFPQTIKYGAARVLVKPAPQGSGIIAGGPMRVVFEVAGIRDVVGKILGTKNKISNVYATIEALKNIAVLVKIQKGEI